MPFLKIVNKLVHLKTFMRKRRREVLKRDGLQPCSVFLNMVEMMKLIQKEQMKFEMYVQQNYKKLHRNGKDKMKTVCM